MEMNIISRVVQCQKEYENLNENFKGLLTFQWFLSYKNPSWSKKEIEYRVNEMKENRALIARWKEDQRDPTPIRSPQPCYSCKVLWEPDHRCRGKDQEHIIEAHHDSDDEDLVQFDDDSVSCTEASDSDSCTEADNSRTLEEDSDPCVVDRQSGEQDDSTSTSADKLL
jgi:hypothetical protein